jgi:hypothetical protein
MSVTESKAKATVKTSKKSVNPAEAAALKAALEAAQIEMVPLSALVKSPLNVRTIPYPADSVREMADSIMAIGLIQNLVVHSLPDGMSGVAAGGRRLAALQQLLSEQRIDAGYPLSSSVSVTTWRWSPRWSRTTSVWPCIRQSKSAGSVPSQNRGKPRRKSGTSWATVPVTFSAC